MTTCKHCGKPIPQTFSQKALYCSGNCQNRASYLRNVHAHTARESPTRADTYKLLKKLENEAITAQHLRELRPVVERYAYHVASPFLGVEFSIY